MPGIPNWFTEKIRDQVRTRYRSKGGFLDGTMMRGEGGAGVVKFPVVGGRIEMYELSGAIQKVKLSDINLDMLTLVTKDFEAATTFRSQDVRKMGPSLQAALADEMGNAVRRKRDKMKLDALNTFAGATSTLTDAPTTVQTIGTGAERVDLLDAIAVADQITGAGSDEELYWAIPNVWFSQLLMYKEFSNADYLGDKELPFAMNGRVNKKTFRGVHIMTLPDEHFVYGTGAYVPGTPGFTGTGYLDTFAWSQKAVGCEIEWDQENMTIDPLPEMEGTPNLCKVQLSGAAVGLLPEGVKRIRKLAISSAIRIA
ncbi:Hypothetical protein NGAL_HAMBI2605_59160 [Neorhizobium galegae bv. orientalis]|nr:Hypothetical protein NGAL_HAMBI2605_59160 [Neorhizobium galegae bv. orientalis]